jgi:hypothetical protein
MCRRCRLSVDFISTSREHRLGIDLQQPSCQDISCCDLDIVYAFQGQSGSSTVNKCRKRILREDQDILACAQPPNVPQKPGDKMNKIPAFHIEIALVCCVRYVSILALSCILECLVKDILIKAFER